MTARVPGIRPRSRHPALIIVVALAALGAAGRLPNVARQLPGAGVPARDCRARPRAAGDSLLEYVGRFRQGDTSVLLVASAPHGGLTVRPILWGSFLLLRRVERDSFVVTDRPSRVLVFHRDAAGCIDAARAAQMGGDGSLPRLDAGSTAPIELLVAGRTSAAVRGFRATGLPDSAVVALAMDVLTRIPSRADAVHAFLAAWSTGPKPAGGLAALATSEIAIGRRADALADFRRALARDSSNAVARLALLRLDESSVSAPGAAILPFTLRRLLAEPTAAERAAVVADWRRRDLRPASIDTAAIERIPLGADSATALVVSHEIAGSRRYGVLVEPDGATGRGCCAAVVEVRGVAWNYPPLTVPNGLFTPALLADRGKFIYVVPGIRGETLVVNGHRYVSAGDRRDAFDGAADDAIAFLAVARRIAPRIDSSRVCIAGHSRGATVALLAGERSPAFRCVVAMAAPVDWFTLMPGGDRGWTTAEVLRGALATRATPDQDGGQFIERYLQPAIDGSWSLRDARHRMLASSPLYFVERLPITQAHFGIEDSSVPIANGTALRRAVAARRPPRAPPVRVFFYPNAGHDTDRPRAYPLVAGFLARECRSGAP